MAKNAQKALVGVMALGTFVVVLDNTIMNVSISALVKDLNTTVSGVQAAISLNALMMAAFVLMGGKMADIFGMRRTFLLGSLIYISGSLLASFSNNIWVFVTGWCAIQGFGAALMLPNVTTIIRTYMQGNARAKAYGTMAAINAVGLALGPLIGGFLTTYFSWRWAFRLEVFCLVGMLLFSGVIPKDSLKKIKPKLDKLGVVWQASAMVLIVLGVLMVSDYGLLIAKQPLTIGGFEFAPFGLSPVPFVLLVGMWCLMMFARRQRKLDAAGKEKLVDLKLFKANGFTRGLTVRFSQVALMAGTTFAVPLFLQVTFGLSAFETGFILLGFTAGLLITGIGATKIGLQYLPKQKIKTGFLVAILGLFVMAAFVWIGTQPAGLIPGIFIYGLGLGLITSQIVNLIMTTIEPKQTAEAAGVTSTLETLGSSIGTAIVGTVLVVALSGGIGRLVNQSIVFSDSAKTQISSEISGSVEVVSNQVLIDNIGENGAYEEEAISIYDKARDNAFIITILFMAAVAGISFLIAQKLPANKAAGELSV